MISWSGDAWERGFDLVGELEFPENYNSRTPSGTLAPELTFPGTFYVGAKQKFSQFYGSSQAAIMEAVRPT